MDKNVAKSTLQTVDRALQLLEILSEYPEGLAAKALEESLELNKVTVHRLLATLENRGFVERVGNSYQIGLKVVELSSRKLNNVELKTEAAPYLRSLVNELGLPVQLAIIDGYEAIFIDKVQSVNSFRMYSQIGKRIPLYASGVGKALLMEESDEAILTRLEPVEFKAFTQTTLKSKEAVLEAVKEARKLGYAIDDEEHEAGIYCIAVPIWDYRGEIIAALSVGDTKRSFIEKPEEKCIERIKETSLKISKRLGYMS